jgi:pimeloyl-ACP methyl ester carboxylesterase
MSTRLCVVSMGSKTALALSLALGLSACIAGDGSDGAGTTRPTFEPVRCPADVALVVLIEVTCGVLIVPAHHAEPDRGNLRLFFARMRPDVARPEPAPVLALGGDLGVTPDYETLGRQVPGLGREVIVLDARGTGHSEPSLVCPEVDALPHAPTQVRVDDARTRTDFLEAVTGCRERLVSQGVDLSAFDLTEMAADAEDLRVALGIERWNVMAIGTTARIALEYVRRSPEHIRAAVLDSPEWPGVDPFVESIEATRHAISELSAACSEDVVCRRFTPDFDEDVRTVIRRLDAKPYVADYGEDGQVLFDAGWFLVWLRARMSYIRPPGTFVPHAVAEFARGSQEVLRLQASRLEPDTDDFDCQGYLPNCWTHLVRSFGVYLSVICRDVVPFTDHSSLGGLVDGDPGYQETFGRTPFLDACEAWDAGRGDAAVATRVRSDVPTLVIVGRFDPFGMPPHAEDGMAELTNGYLVVSPVNGHQVTGTEQELPDLCMVRIRDAWLDDPTSAPDTSCIHSVRLDYALPLDWKI